MIAAERPDTLDALQRDARLHGDEFVLVMPGAATAQAEPRLESLAERIERKPLKFGNTLIPIGLSYGLAVYDGNMAVEDLLRESDRAMYSRKQARRSQKSVE